MQFLTMELLQGQSLSRRIRDGGPLKPEEALPLIEQMAAALDAAHAVGVIHRDFKPGNVLLVNDESGKHIRAVVTDFGLALPAPAAGQTAGVGTAVREGLPAIWPLNNSRAGR